MAIVHLDGLHLLCEFHQRQIPAVGNIGGCGCIGERPHGIGSEIGQSVQGRCLVRVNAACLHAAMHQAIAPGVGQRVIEEPRHIVQLRVIGPAIRIGHSTQW